MLTKALIANRCVERGAVGLKFHNKNHLVFIPTGHEAHDISGEIEYVTFGFVKYKVAEPIVAHAHDVVVITPEPGVLKFVILSGKSGSRTITTEHGRMDPTNDIGVHPPPTSFGLPDEHLEVHELAERYMNRLITISKRNLTDNQSKLFFASTSAGEDRFDDLINTLTNMGKDPKAERDKGIPPSNSRIAVTPDPSPKASVESKKDIPENLRRLSRAQGAVSLYSNIWSIAMRTKRGHPEPYRVTDPQEATQANADTADSTVAALTGPLSGYFTRAVSKPGKFEQSMTAVEFHIEFLKKFFDDWSFSPAQLKELDAILKEVAAMLANLKISVTTTGSGVSHTMLTRSFRELTYQNADGEDEIIAYEPFLRLTYLSCNQHSFELAVGNKSSVLKIDFLMNYEDDIYNLNVDVFEENMPVLDGVIHKLIGKNMEEFGSGLAWATLSGQTKQDTT